MTFKRLSRTLLAGIFLVAASSAFAQSPGSFGKTTVNGRVVPCVLVGKVCSPVNIDGSMLGGAPLPPSVLPAPTATTPGGVLSAVAPAHQFATGVDATGKPTFGQPAAGDVSGLAASATTDTTNAGNIGSGTLPAGRLPAPTPAALGGVLSAGAPSHQFATGVDATGKPTFGQPAAGDVSGLAASATTDTTNAGNIGSGTLPAGRLPAPTPAALGGVLSAGAPSHQFGTGVDATGKPTFGQPAAGDVSGLAASATTDTTNAANIGSGTLPAGRLPVPTPAALGGVLSAAAPPHQFGTGVDGNGRPSFAQPAASDVSGLAASATTDTTNAANLSSGTLPPARIPAPTSSTPGGVLSAAAPSHQFGTGVDGTGKPTFAQPASGDVSGLAASATTDTTNAANIGSGTLPAGRLPVATPASLGAVFSGVAAAHQFGTGVDGTGKPTFAQPAAGDVSGLAPSATTDTTNAANIGSGTLPAGRLPAPSTSTLGGVFSGTAAAHQFETGVDATGKPTFAQPAAGDVSGLAPSATTDTTNAANIGSGTLPIARLPVAVYRLEHGTLPITATNGVGALAALPSPIAAGGVCTFSIDHATYSTDEPGGPIQVNGAQVTWNPMAPGAGPLLPTSTVTYLCTF